MIQVLSCFQKAATYDGANVATRLPCVRRSTCMFTAKQQLVLERKTMQGVGAIVVARLHAYRRSLEATRGMFVFFDAATST